MLPVVDANWCPQLLEDNALIHVLRAVSVQSPMEFSDALASLETLSQYAETPGLGGLPQGVVLYADPFDVDARQSLLTLDNAPRVRGLHVQLDALQQSEQAQLSAAKEFLLERQWSLTLSGEIAQVSNMVSQFQGSGITLVCHLAECSDVGQPLSFSAWPDFVQGLANNSNLQIMITSAPAESDLAGMQRFSDILKWLIKLIGESRLFFSSGRPDPHTAAIPLWLRFDSATDWAGAGTRDALFRENAVRIYQI